MPPSVSATRSTAHRVAFRAGPLLTAHANTVGLCGLLAACMAACVAGQADQTPRIEPRGILRDGSSFSGRLSGISDQNEFVFDTDDRPRRIAWDELVLWGRYADRELGTHIVLADGSLLVADLLALEAESVVIEGRLWSRTRLPRERVRAIIFQPPADTLQRDRLVLCARESDRREDRLLLDNGDELAGSTTAWPDQPDPGVMPVTEIRWPLAGQTQPLPVPVNRILAILLAADAPETPSRDPGILVGWRDGSRVAARRLFHTDQRLNLELIGGPSVSTEPTAVLAHDPWVEVTMLQPLQGSVTYLSDLPAAGYRHVPFLGGDWTYQTDRSVSGGQQRQADQVFAKGLGMHSSSRLVFDLQGDYRWFHAELAIDARTGRDGSIVFRVFTQDAGGQWSQVFESGVVRGGDMPVPVRVDIERAVYLALVVDFADRGDQWDHANWLNARVVRSPDR